MDCSRPAKHLFPVHSCHPWRGFNGSDNPQPQHPCCVVRREKDTLSVFFCFRLTLYAYHPLSLRMIVLNSPSKPVGDIILKTLCPLWQNKSASSADKLYTDAIEAGIKPFGRFAQAAFNGFHIFHQVVNRTFLHRTVYIFCKIICRGA